MRPRLWLFGLTMLMLVGAGCATSESPSAQPAEVQTPERTTLDCLNLARRVRPSFDGRPQMTIDQNAYQRCLDERRQTSPAPAR
jgi:hypothetical protein